MSTSAIDAARDLLLDFFERVHEGVADVVDGLAIDELLWRPDGSANHIAWLVWHLARQQDDQVAHLAGTGSVWLHGDWADRFQLPYDRRVHGYGMSPEQVGSFTIADPSLFASYHEAVHAQSVELVESLSPDDLARVVDASYDPPVTLSVRLVSVVDDAVKHLGQAEYVRGLVKRQ